MDKQFKFTDARIRALPANPPSSRSTEPEVNDTELTASVTLIYWQQRSMLLVQHLPEARGLH